MSRKGRDLERLVEALEKLQSQYSDFKVESPAYIRDRDTNQPREIDVLLTHTVKNKVTRIGFECKDQSRPIDVPKLEAFHAKAKALDLDSTVFVSSSGYYRPCVMKAAAYGMLLYTLDQCLNFDWLRVAGILEDFVEIKEISIHDELNRQLPPEKLIDEDGLVMSLAKLADIFATKQFEDFPLLNIDPKSSAPTNVTNRKTVLISGVSIPAMEISMNPRPREIFVTAEFRIFRIFSLFGNFAYRRTSSKLKFAKVHSAFVVDDKIETLFITEMNDAKLSGFGSGGSSTGNVRCFRRLVSWENLEHRLIEAGRRHTANVSPEADMLTFSGFTSKAEKKEWQGDNKWPELKKAGAATFNFN